MIAAVSRLNTKSTPILDVILTMLLMVHMEFITLPLQLNGTPRDRGITKNENTLKEQTYRKSKSYNRINCIPTGLKNTLVEGCAMLYPAKSGN
jgi:hypothetical protein